MCHFIFVFVVFPTKWGCAPRQIIPRDVASTSAVTRTSLCQAILVLMTGQEEEIPDWDFWFLPINPKMQSLSQTKVSIQDCPELQHQHLAGLVLAKYEGCFADFLSLHSFRSLNISHKPEVVVQVMILLVVLVMILLVVLFMILLVALVMIVLLLVLDVLVLKSMRNLESEQYSYYFDTDNNDIKILLHAARYNLDFIFFISLTPVYKCL